MGALHLNSVKPAHLHLLGSLVELVFYVLRLLHRLVWPREDQELVLQRAVFGRNDVVRAIAQQLRPRNLAAAVVQLRKNLDVWVGLMDRHGHPL